MSKLKSEQMVSRWYLRVKLHLNQSICSVFSDAQTNTFGQTELFSLFGCGAKRIDFQIDLHKY